MSLSAPVPTVPPLPAGQAALATLLVDRPQLASLAMRYEVPRLVTDPRLSPLVAAILADRQPPPAMNELLALVPKQAEALVYEVVFSGKFRDSENPETELREQVWRCEEDELERAIGRLEHRSKQALAKGAVDEARELNLEKLALRRRQVELRNERINVRN